MEQDHGPATPLDDAFGATGIDVRPDAVTWFMRLNYLAIGIGATSFLVELPTAVSALSGPAILGVVIGLGIASLFLAFMVGLIKWAGEGQNWARWALLLLTVSGVLLASRNPEAALSQTALPLGIAILQWLTQAIGILLAFLPSSNRWYRAIAMAEERESQ